MANQLRTNQFPPKNDVITERLSHLSQLMEVYAKQNHEQLEKIGNHFWDVKKELSDLRLEFKAQNGRVNRLEELRVSEQKVIDAIAEAQRNCPGTKAANDINKYKKILDANHDEFVLYKKENQFFYFVSKYWHFMLLFALIIAIILNVLGVVPWMKKLLGLFEIGI